MQIEAIDKQMNIEHNGVTYQNHDGVINVPDSVGNKFLETNRNAKTECVGRYTKSYSLGHGISQERWNQIFGK